MTDKDALLDRIAFDRDMLGGKAHIRGTRVGVGHILAALATGETPEQIVDELPWLVLEDIQAALYYAAQSADRSIIIAAE
ncbi:DUF433 domain-containing protein [uncultured Devosia sp.]|uniref:DUF433 domain-containing protein n=1 Tax=uncultured Devosia sp. TaxID=211434 RepID=UPI0035CC0A27